MKIAIVASEFNHDITSKMVEKAKEEIKKQNGSVLEIIKVPGALEIPFAVQQIINKADGVVTFGAIIQGKTAHDIVIGESIAPALLDLSLKHNKPVAFGVIGPRATRKQAEERAEEYAVRAVNTVFSLEKIKNN